MSERDKFLTEQMGECWHIYRRILPKDKWECWKCGCKEHYLFKPKSVNNFSTWQGFGKLWEWAQKQEWWNKFVNLLGINRGLKIYQLIHPDRFADALYQFLKERK